MPWQELPTHIKLLQLRFGFYTGVAPILNSTVIAFKNLGARIPKLGKGRRYTDRGKSASLKPSAITTYSA